MSGGGLIKLLRELIKLVEKSVLGLAILELENNNFRRLSRECVGWVSSYGEMMTLKFSSKSRLEGLQHSAIAGTLYELLVVHLKTQEKKKKVIVVQTIVSVQ